VKHVEGVVRAELGFPSGLLTVEYERGHDPREAIAAVARAAGHGFEADPSAPAAAAEPATWWSVNGHLATLVASGALLLLGYAAGALRATALADTVFVLAVLAGGLVTARRAWTSLRMLRLDMNVLMSLAVIGAIVLGDFAEAATVIFLFSIGQFLESRALERTRRSVRDLIALTPATVRLRRNGKTVELPVADAVAGDTVIVKPGERIALDGTVSSGMSAVDEAPVTGESVPVDKEPGDRVYAGTMNVHGVIEVDVAGPAADSTLARLIHLVEEAQSQRAPSQRLVDSFTRYYTPAVVVGAALVAVLPPLLGAGTWAEWAYRSLVVLVVSCPCALVISTPVAIVSAITRASRDGVLVKGGVHLETAARIRVVAMDKTGTLTCGRPEVTDVVPMGAGDSSRVLRIAAALELGSSHPVAEAVLRAELGTHAPGEVHEHRAAQASVDTAGKGVRAIVEDVEYVIGSPAMAAEEGALTEESSAAIAILESAGKTVLVLTAHGSVQGLIGLADDVRPESPRVVTALRSAGMTHLVMLTGDNDRVAAAVAAHAGLTEFRSRLLPEQKSDAVAELRGTYGPVAMVGDGINDAPALASADLGIAMGAAGSDTALETADVALMAPDLRALPGFFDLGRRTVSIIRFNVAFSVVTKAAVLVLAVLGHAPLWLAVFADTGVSLLVTLNGLRLLRRGKYSTV